MRYVAVLLFFPVAVLADTHALIVGVFSKDAQTVAKAIRRASAEQLRLRVLHRDEATRDAILERLDALQGKVKKKDNVLIYLSGHGTTRASGHFSLWCFDKKNVWCSELFDRIEDLPGNKILLVDTCKPSGILNRPWKTTTVVCAGGHQTTWTGVMGPALQEALVGMADENEDGKIEIKEIAQYVSWRIQQISLTQKPEMHLGVGTSGIVSVPVMKWTAGCMWIGKWWPVQVLARRGNSYKVLWATGEVTWEAGRDMRWN